MKKIGIACDHAGYDMKEFLVGYLSAKGYEVIDFGTHSEESVDYPDFAHALATSVETGETEQGIGLCGSGEGMAMTLNKHQGIHNDANVLVLPARFIDNDEAVAIVDKFFSSSFEGGRHVRRVEKIACE